MSGSRLKTYDSIYVLPLLNYDRYIATSKPKWLEPDHEEKKDVDYNKIESQIIDEIIDYLGVDHFTHDIETLKNDILIAKIEVEVNDVKSFKGKIKQLEEELQELTSKESQLSLIENLIDVNRVIGYRMNPQTTTVYEYLVAMKKANDIAKQQKKKSNELNK